MQHLQFYQESPNPIIDAYIWNNVVDNEVWLKLLSFIHGHLENHLW